MNKQHILDEIRRTARANGGRALGRRAFEAETGIKESDWAGRYWARWGDVIREAGFAPKQLQRAFDPDSTLAQLVALARELGRFPVRNEMRMRKRRDPDFPNDKVFDQFGAKAELARSLLKYCNERPGHEDVRTMCQPIADATTAEPDTDHDDAEPDFGFVYLIKSGRYFKIGRSNAAGRREREIALQLPERANTVHVIRTDDPPGIEAYWHQRFADRRKNGEWFELSGADVKAFKRRKFM